MVLPITPATKIHASGLFTMPEEIYHADPCPTPALSSTLAKLVIERSLRHARLACPRYADDRDQDEDEAVADAKTENAKIFGSVVHALALGKGAPIIVLPFGDFKTKAAREERAALLLQGKLPILEHKHRQAVKMAAIARLAFQDHLGVPVEQALVEVTIASVENTGTPAAPRFGWRRGRLDIAAPNLRTIIDYKSTKASAEPEAATRTLYSFGYHFQEAHYTRILDAIDPAGAGKRRFLFAFQETDPPHAMSLLETDPAAKEMAAREVAKAAVKWDRAVEFDQWPGYPGNVHIAQIPPWLLSKFNMAEFIERSMSDKIFEDAPE
jgi:hypothetical protein